MIDMKISVLFGMDTMEIETDGTNVSTTMYTDRGKQPGGKWTSIDAFLDDMYDIGYSRKCRAAFVNAGILPG